MEKALFIIIFILASWGCGGRGSYVLKWTIGCANLNDQGCQIQSVSDCSRYGIDSIKVDATQGNTVAHSLFPCYSFEKEEAVGIGPELDPGATGLKVCGLSPGGLLLTSQVEVTTNIPEDDLLVPVSVNLPAPPQCRDGVDNDGDGLVDRLDSGCESSRDETE